MTPYFPAESSARRVLAGEQFLHRALFEVALLGEELLQGFDEGIRIAQRLGDGFLLGFGGRERRNIRSNLRCKLQRHSSVSIAILNCKLLKYSVDIEGRTEL